MKALIRALPGKAEFTIVVALGFGMFIYASVTTVVAPRTPATFNRAGLSFLLIYELVVLVVILWFLRARGWRLRDFHLSPSIVSTVYGILFALGAYVAHWVIWVVAASIFPELLKTAGETLVVSRDIPLGMMLAVSLVNPVYEELLVVGYVVSSLKRSKGVWFAVGVSAAIRLLYHLYQGPVSAIWVLFLGIVFAYWYARTNKLWPPIVAHAFFDFIGLFVYSL